MRKTFLRMLSGTMMLLAMMAGSSSSSQAQTTVTIGSGTTTTSYYPLYSCYGYNYSQQIYLGSEVTAAGWTGGGTISKIRFYQSTTATPESNFNDWTIYLGNTTQNTFTSTSNWIPVSSMTNVFSGIVTLTGVGWKEITLTTPFVYTGGNLVVAVDENAPNYSCTAAWRSYTSTSGNRAMLYYSDGTNPNPASPPNANNGPGTAIAQFQFDVVSLTPCTGMPAGGITVSGMPGDSVCSGIPTNLAVTGSSSSSGITYQWQSSVDGGSTWTNISGATGNMYAASPSVPTCYRRTATCGPSGLSATSAPVCLTIRSFLGCYCIPPITYTWDNYITNVNFAGISNPSGAATSGYADYTGSVAAGGLLGGIPSPITVNLYNPYGASLAVWIDFNHSGTFDPGEFTSLAGDYSMATTVTGMVNVPTDALAGITRMRVRTQYDYALTATDACNNLPTGYNEGETEDYYVNVSIPVPCTGTPSAALTAGATSVCTDEPFALNATSAGAFSGITYLFQVSTDGGTIWTNVAPASSSFSVIVPTQSVASDYRVIVACAGSGLADTSTSVTVGQNPVMACVCIPVYSSGCTFGDDLDGFVLNGEAGSAINNVGVGCVGGSYSDYTSMSVDLLTGNTYSGVVTTTYSGTYEDFRIWIDYNDNGVFETSESVAFVDGIGLTTPGNFTITVPSTAPLGNHRLRVRLVYSTTAATIDPCSSYSYGETHDYTVHVIAPCTMPVVNLGADTAICAGSGLTLDAGNPGLTFTWSTGDTSQTVSVTTAGTYTVTVADGTCVTMDTIVVSVNAMPVVDLGADISGCVGDTLMLNAGNPGATYLWNTGDNTQTINVITTGTYSVSVTSTGSCTASDTLSVIVNDYPVVYLGVDTAICTESIIMLNAENPGATFNWSTGDNTQTIIVNSAATYTVTVTNGVCITSDSITVDEVEAPVAGAIVVVDNMPDFEFSVTGTEGAATYLWDFGDGTVANTDTASKTYTANGTYNVTLIVLNDCGQSDTATTEIIVSGLGIDALNGAAHNVQVYPNPSSGLTVIEAKGAVISNIEVVDNLGRVVQRHQPESAKASFDVKGMAQGIYTIRVTTSKGLSTLKLVVKD